MTAEQRREALKRRQERAVKTREQRKGRMSILNLDVPERKEVSWFVIDKGEQLVDIVPYIITTDKHPDRDTKDNFCLPGYTDYKLEIWQHRDVGANNSKVLCMRETFGKSCSICEELDNPELSEEEYKALVPKRRVFYNVVDLNSKEQEVQLWEASWFWSEERILKEAEYSKKGEEVSDWASLEEGKTIVFRGEAGSLKKRDGTPVLEPTRYSFRDREPYDETILQETYPLDAMLVIPTYKEVEKIFRWTEGIEKETSEEQEAEEVADGKEQSNPCPSNHTFGTDNDTNDDCTECSGEEYDSCAKKKKELISKETSPTKRRGRR